MLQRRGAVLDSARGVPYVSVAPFPSLRVATTLCFTFLYLLLLVHLSLVFVRIRIHLWL